MNTYKIWCVCLSITLLIGASSASAAKRLKQVKQPLVVLTFDDATVGHRTNVAPMLKKYRFGGTFYVCEFSGFEDKQKYLTWEQIGEISKMGFEIGNHSRSHGAMAFQSTETIKAETEYIEQQCSRYGIPHPATYAYPGYSNSAEGRALLQKMGYTLARHGGDKYLQPHISDKMLLPSFAIQDSNFSEEYIHEIMNGLQRGEIVIFCLHGVPDLAHDFVSLSPENFRKFLDIIKSYGYKVISMRDLLKYDL